MAIRPEKIRIEPVGTPAAADEVAVDGVVAERVYAGAETRVVVDVPGGTRLTALLLNTSSVTGDVQRGDRVTLRWQRSAERVIGS